MSNKINLIDDELWDHYSGLPNPMWYQYITEINDEKENTNDSADNTVSTR